MTPTAIRALYEKRCSTIDLLRTFDILISHHHYCLTVKATTLFILSLDQKGLLVGQAMRKKKNPRS